MLESGLLAQRRPEPKPRRHKEDPNLLDARGHRSTKAGAETPATRSMSFARIRSIGDAQRRPEPKPRRHPDVRAPRLSRRKTLNEGRSRNPGDTGQEFRLTHAQPRKAGAPATLPPFPSTEDTARSTKAGAETPATPAKHSPDRTPRPGAQRRPEPKPRRHPLGRPAAQRRPEPKPRRHGPRLREIRSIGTAQRRPEPKPRRHPPWAMRLAAFGNSAQRRRAGQRRPEPKPRRHR